MHRRWVLALALRKSTAPATPVRDSCKQQLRRAAHTGVAAAQKHETPVLEPRQQLAGRLKLPG